MGDCGEAMRAKNTKILLRQASVLAALFLAGGLVVVFLVVVNLGVCAVAAPSLAQPPPVAQKASVAQQPSVTQESTVAQQPFFVGVLAEAEAGRDRALDKHALINMLVHVEKGQKGDPSVPDGVVQRVKEGLLVYPRSFICFLLNHNCPVYVAPFVTRADTSLDGQKPVAYPQGSTYQNCRAVFTTKGILIGSHFYRDGKLLPNMNPLQGAQHEAAHAMDQFLGRPSLSSEFLAIYESERDGVSVVDRAPLAYYLHGGRIGPIETFGQLLAHKYSHFTEHHTLALARCFPHCAKFIDERFPKPDPPGPSAIGEPIKDVSLPAKTPAASANTPVLRANAPVPQANSPVSRSNTSISPANTPLLH
jgi:hypothetical protein